MSHLYKHHSTNILGQPSKVRDLILDVCPVDKNGNWLQKSTRKSPSPHMRRRSHILYNIPPDIIVALKSKISIMLVAMNASNKSASLPEIRDVIQVLLIVLLYIFSLIFNIQILHKQIMQ